MINLLQIEQRNHATQIGKKPNEIITYRVIWIWCRVSDSRSVHANRSNRVRTLRRRVPKSRAGAQRQCQQRTGKQRRRWPDWEFKKTLLVFLADFITTFFYSFLLLTLTLNWMAVRFNADNVFISSSFQNYMKCSQAVVEGTCGAQTGEQSHRTHFLIYYIVSLFGVVKTFLTLGPIRM